MEASLVTRFLVFVATVQSALGKALQGDPPYEDVTFNSILFVSQDKPVKDIVSPGNSQYPAAVVFGHDFSHRQNAGVMDYYTTEGYNSTTTTTESYENHNVDTWSIMWYLISFGGLITFFLLVSFSEVCCKKPLLILSEVEEQPEEVSPPPYDLFAPPTYDSLFEEKSESKKKPRSKTGKYSVYVIPVHDKPIHELPREDALEFGEVVRRNPMGDGEVVTPPPPP